MSGQSQCNYSTTVHGSVQTSQMNPLCGTVRAVHSTPSGDVLNAPPWPTAMKKPRPNPTFMRFSSSFES